MKKKKEQRGASFSLRVFKVCLFREKKHHLAGWERARPFFLLLLLERKLN